MGKYDKILLKVVSGKSDNAIRFNELTELSTALGFIERIKGSHHIYYRNDVAEILNFQPQSGMAKPYQVRQLRSLIEHYGLELCHDD